MINEVVEVKDAVNLWKFFFWEVGCEAAWRNRVVARKTPGSQGFLKSWY